MEDTEQNVERQIRCPIEGVLSGMLKRREGEVS